MEEFNGPLVLHGAATPESGPHDGEPALDESLAGNIVGRNVVAVLLAGVNLLEFAHGLLSVGLTHGVDKKSSS